MDGFLEMVEELEDPRGGNAQRYVLGELLYAAFATSLCGAQTCVDMEDFAQSKLDFLRQRLPHEHGAQPRHVLAAVPGPGLGRLREVVHEVHGGVRAGRAGGHERDARGGQHVDRQDPGPGGACLRLDLQRHEGSTSPRRGTEAGPFGTPPGARRVKQPRLVLLVEAGSNRI